MKCAECKHKKDVERSLEVKINEDVCPFAKCVYKIERDRINDLCEEYKRIRKIVIDIGDFSYEELLSLTTIILSWKISKGDYR